MNKSVLLDGKNKDEQILLSKILDKVEESKKKNKITNTDFLNEYEQVLTKELLNEMQQSPASLFVIHFRFRGFL